MGVRTGNPKGRPKGARNKKTVEAVAKIEASGLTPLDYMLGVLRNENLPHEERMDAAKSAAPYVHARLASVESTGPGGGALVVNLVGPDADL